MTEHHGKIWWNELNTRDVAAAKDHYGRVFGWTFETMPMDSGEDYVLALHDGAPVAGLFPLDNLPQLEGVPSHWFTYLAVADLEKAVETTVSGGGSIKRPPFDVPGTGRFAIVEDPSGAVVGYIQPQE
jgi:predicted enzyme related to lactoylglutathione lyase